MARLTAAARNALPDSAFAGSEAKLWFGWPVTRRVWTASCSSTTDSPMICPSCGSDTHQTVGLMGSGEPLVCVECWEVGA